MFEDLRKTVEYTNITQDELWNILYCRSSVDRLDLESLYGQNNKLFPCHLDNSSLLDNLCADLLPSAAVDGDLDLIKKQIASKKSREEVIAIIEEEFWRVLSSTPFGALIDFAVRAKTTIPLFSEEVLMYLSCTDPAIIVQTCSGLFCWFSRFFLSTHFEQSPFLLLRKYARGVDRAKRDLSSSLYMLDIAKLRVRTAFQARTESSWLRIDHPPLSLEIGEIPANAHKLTQQHALMLESITETDILDRTDPFLDSCKTWVKLVDASSEAVAVRPENVKPLLLLIKVNHSSSFFTPYSG